jgi:hypothetical protein
MTNIKFPTSKERGFVIQIALLVFALIFLNVLFDINVYEFLKSPKAQEIVAPTISFLKSVFNWLADFVRSIIK